MDHRSYSVVFIPWGIRGQCNKIGWELLDSRWNGNEALKWSTDRGHFFVKMNRVEDLSVFMSEVTRNQRTIAVLGLSVF